MNLQTICRALAWASILAIVVITDGPIGLRPTTALPPNVERFAALAVVGLLFALAYPARRLIVLGALVVAVGALELGGLHVLLCRRQPPGRRPRRDPGALGLGAGHLIDMVMQNRERMPAAPDPQQ